MAQALSRTLCLRLAHQRSLNLQHQCALVELSKARYSTKEDDVAGGSLLNRLWRGKPKDAPKDADGASSSSSKGDGSASGGSGRGGSKASEGDERPSNSLVPSGPERRHHKVFVVELARKPLFPGIYTPVMIKKNEALLKEIMEVKRQGAQAYVGAFLKRPEPHPAAVDPTAAPAVASVSAFGAEEGDAASHMYDIGTFAQITSDPLRVHIEHLRDEHYASDDILKATSMEIVNTMRDLLQLNPLYGEQFRTLLSLTGSLDLQDLSRLVDAAASLTSADDSTLQGVLEQLSVPDRSRMVLGLLKKEVELCKLQADIREQVEGKIVKEQRRMMLLEQLKSIKKELGLERDDKSALLQRFQSRWDEKKAAAPPDVAKAVQDELDKLGGLEPVSPEFNMTRTYLDWLVSLPWGVTTQEMFDLARAKKVLDDDHYGLEDVKDRILEFIAVSHLRGSAQGKILCLVGPPGVGKTSVGRSIAHALNRKYYRFSVGGLHDVAEIKGHRWVYRKVALKLVRAGARPVPQPAEPASPPPPPPPPPAGDGTAASASSPEPSTGFAPASETRTDDASSSTSSSSADASSSSSGSTAGSSSTDAGSGTVGSGAAASGSGAAGSVPGPSGSDASGPPTRPVVRVEYDGPPIVVGREQLKEYVGQAPFAKDRFYESTPPGVVMGLAWTPMGGATLYVEAAKVSGSESRGGLVTTGQLGDVFKESASIAHTFARNYLASRDPANGFFGGAALHVHVPAGATPKDGPSAGCTLVTALLSLALGRPVKPDLAMTGGAASGLTAAFVSTYDQVFKLALGEDKEEAAQGKQ
ncbi:Lon protease, mitochondrial [Tetrabaena socialis]|uniref:Lon protease homolog n=1 Tax=Tetrabaena socialis TaxID=47790 RepID=A0A2J8ACJ0_9CHLO|nr:Lon protease, mitochondrial [Tetrabaena socialis]|eukprot:PNH10234.1 Lon protease, mitochondrial [Tetrabaena socialis]